MNIFKRVELSKGPDRSPATARGINAKAAQRAVIKMRGESQTRNKEPCLADYFQIYVFLHCPGIKRLFKFKLPNNN